MKKTPLFKRNKPLEVYELLTQETRHNAVASKLEKYHAYDIAEAIEMMTEDDVSRLLSYLNTDKQGAVFAYLDPKSAARLLRHVDDDLAVQVLEAMEPDDAVDLIQSAGKAAAIAWLPNMDDIKRSHLKQLMKHGKATAGGEMNNRIITLKPTDDVKTAMKTLITEASRIEYIDTLFVLDSDKRLLGTVSLQTLIAARSPLRVKQIMKPAHEVMHVDNPLEDVVRTIQKYDIMALPILDKDDCFAGVVTMHDTLDVIDRTSRDDYARLAAVPIAIDRKESIVKAARRRLPWLLGLLALNAIIAVMIFQFVDTVEAALALVMFQPLIVALAGVVATQSLALTVLKRAKESIHRRLDVTRHLIREWAVGTLSGIVLGALAGIIAYGMLQLTDMAVGFEGTLALVVGGSVLAALVIGALIGSGLPLILHMIKVDPTRANGPLLTTFNDFVALAIYLMLVTIFIV